MPGNNFYVYYNNRNCVTGISPINDEFLSKKFKHTKVPYSEVKPFITGEKRQAEAIVVPVEGSVTKFYVTMKTTELGFIHDVNVGLTKIDKEIIKEYDIQIKNFLKKEAIEINFSNQAKRKIKNTEGLSIPRNISFHFTTKDDPSFVLFSFEIDIFEMLKHKIIIKYKLQNIDQLSLFTKKYFDNYSYKDIGKK